MVGLYVIMLIKSEPMTRRKSIANGTKPSLQNKMKGRQDVQDIVDGSLTKKRSFRIHSYFPCYMLIPQSYRVVKCRESHIFWTVGSQVEVRLLALSTGTALYLEQKKDLVVLISVRGWVNPSARVRLEGLGKLKKSNGLLGTQNRDLPICRSCTSTIYTAACPDFSVN
jgi:hypothetical protein